MFGLPTTAVTNQLQNILMFMGGIGVARGMFSADQLGALVGGVVALVTIVSNYQTHQQALDTPPAPPKPTPAQSAVAVAPAKSMGLPG
jgi:hypothetical protein